MMMYEKTKWETKNRNDGIDKLIGDKEEIMELKLGEWEENGGLYSDLRDRYDIYIEKKNIKDYYTKAIQKLIKDKIKVTAIPLFAQGITNL